jgi:NAD(P)-dependent dehydrogenase (short-subunit alcohol dehydrogenase family)
MIINKSNKLTIVTGASGGIGAAIVQAFLKEEHEVIGIDKDLNAKIFDDKYTHYTCDITDFKKLQNIIEKINFRDSNTLINCAGIREICSISDLSIESWQEVISVNVSSVFVSSKTFAEKIKISPELTGSIVNIASVSGLLGEPDRTAYVTSKHAVIGLTKQLAIEYGKFGIRANAVAPGVIRTPLTEQYYADPEQLKKIASGQFVNYFATPEDITPLVLFLASDNSKFITGATMIADGGWTAGKLI